MSTPVNRNFLQNVKWQFSIQRLPGLTYYAQSVNIPSLSMARVDTPTPFVRFPNTGDHLDFGELYVTFKVSEDLSNYLEIHNWMIGAGFPDNFEQFNSLVNKPVGADKEYSDATLLLQTNAKNVSYEISFSRCFPIFLSDVELSTMTINTPEIDCTVTFAYQRYFIRAVS